MTNEEKQLLLKDLCGRLTYATFVQYTSKLGKVIVKKLTGSDIEVIYDGYYPERYKPYLRPLSGMTKEEARKYNSLYMERENNNEYDDLLQYSELLDWLNSHHFDYRGLIKKGLALEAPEGMYKFD